MRRKPELLDLDICTWPTVALTALGETDREAFQKRKEAIERYVRGDSIQAIEQATGINRGQLYHWLKRCLVQHEDGRLYGFRALLRYQRMVAYTRIAKLSVQGEHGGSGANCQIVTNQFPLAAKSYAESTAFQMAGVRWP